MRSGSSDRGDGSLLRHDGLAGRPVNTGGLVASEGDPLTDSFPSISPERLNELEAQENKRIVRNMWVSVLAMVIFSVILGVALKDVNSQSSLGKWDIPSGIIGWGYFVAWSISFYPQVFMNFKRKSVVGLSFDYQVLNLVGFTAYSIYNASFFWNSAIQQEYKDAHNGEGNKVDANDVFFALHAVALTLVTLVQIAIYERGGQRVSLFATALATIGVLMSVLYAAFVAAGNILPEKINSWVDVVIFLSYIKLAITLTKYTPQVILNWRRKTTDGFNVYNVLLDFAGGLLSVVQLLMDCAVTGDWKSGIGGDPVKFALGFTSMFFDIIFMVQHYVLYAENNRVYNKSRQALLLLHGEDKHEMERLLNDDSILKAGGGGTRADKGSGKV